MYTNVHTSTFIMFVHSFPANIRCNPRSVHLAPHQYLLSSNHLPILIVVQFPFTFKINIDILQISSCLYLLNQTFSFVVKEIIYFRFELNERCFVEYAPVCWIQFNANYLFIPCRLIVDAFSIYNHWFCVAALGIKLLSFCVQLQR